MLKVHSSNLGSFHQRFYEGAEVDRSTVVGVGVRLEWANYKYSHSDGAETPVESDPERRPWARRMWHFRVYGTQ